MPCPALLGASIPCKACRDVLCPVHLSHGGHHENGTSSLTCRRGASLTRRAPWPYAFLIPIQPPVKLPCLLLTLTHCRCRWPTWRNRDHHPLCHPCRRIGRCPPPTSPHSLYGPRSSTRRHRGRTGLFDPSRDLSGWRP